MMRLLVLALAALLMSFDTEVLVGPTLSAKGVLE